MPLWSPDLSNYSWAELGWFTIQGSPTLISRFIITNIGCQHPTTFPASNHLAPYKVRVVFSKPCCAAREELAHLVQPMVLLQQSLAATMSMSLGRWPHPPPSVPPFLLMQCTVWCNQKCTIGFWMVNHHLNTNIHCVTLATIKIKSDLWARYRAVYDAGPFTTIGWYHLSTVMFLLICSYPRNLDSIMTHLNATVLVQHKHLVLSIVKHFNK